MKSNSRHSEEHLSEGRPPKTRPPAPDDQREALLTVDNLSVSFDTAFGAIHAVQGLQLGIARGEIVALVGESGSGKSVTAQALLKLLPNNATANYDAIRFNGQRLDQLDEEGLRRYRGGSVGIVFQEPSLSFDPLYPIGDTLLEAVRAHEPSLSDDEARRRIVTSLDEIGIENATQRLKNYPHQFSGGQLQRINLALAIIANPALLIADEPTTALDVTVQAEIIALLKRIIRARSLAVLFISHDITLVSTIADRIAVMYNGHLLEIGNVGDVINTPHHPYSAALLGSLIPFGAHYRDGMLNAISGSPPSPLVQLPGCPFAARCNYVHDACRHALPPLRSDDAPTAYRCLVPGVKTQEAGKDR